MAGRPRTSMLWLMAVVVVLATPVGGAAGERLVGTANQHSGSPTALGGVLAADERGFRWAADSLRIGAGSIPAAGTEPSLDEHVATIGSNHHLRPEILEAEPAAAWPLGGPLPALYLGALDAAATAVDAAGDPASQEEHWSSLPLLGRAARERGYQLPLPFGVSAVYNYVARDIEVTDVRVGVNGAALHSVSDVANFKARSFVDAAVVKVDAWLLPFLDLYVLLGYIKNSTDVNVQVTVPRPGPLPGTRQFTIKAKTELEGFVGGGGLTLAGGYRQFFAMVDVNYTQTDLGFDDRFRALIVSGRAGWNGQVGPVPLRLWGGAAYWDTRNTARSTVDIPDVGSVRFEADQGPKHPWNAVVGASVALHRRLELFAEYGFNFNDVTFFAGGLTFRF